VSLRLEVTPHERLAARAFVTRFARPLGADGLGASPESLLRLLALECDAPLQRSEDVRVAVRDMLRLGGYRPTGRGKPASEYLVRAAGEGTLGAINRAVDACNAVSLASGLPISVVDLARARPPFRLAIPAAGTSYVFNASGQEIDVGGLVSLCDAEGACATAVKDCQRTKTGDATVETLSVIWGVAAHAEHGAAAERWYRHLLAPVGGSTADVELVRD
jgi:DNA/RNA-binding domain of Phe-tRNA-synthetase-like protein